MPQKETNARFISVFLQIYFNSLFHVYIYKREMRLKIRRISLLQLTTGDEFVSLLEGLGRCAPFQDCFEKGDDVVEKQHELSLMIN